MTAPLSTLSVVPSGPFETKDGEPYVRFAKLDSGQAGYYTIGRRPIQECPQQVPKFWERLFFAMAVEGNRAWDAAHTIDPGLCAGAVGFSGDRPVQLLGLCFTQEPKIFLEIMGPAMGDSRVYISDAKRRGTWAFCDKKRETVGLDRLLNGEGWTTRRKESSRRWVSCVSALLHSHIFDTMQVLHLQAEAEAAVTNLLGTAMQWPKRGAAEAWLYSGEQRALWAILLVIALETPRIAESLATLHRAPSALDTLQALQKCDHITSRPRLQNIFKHIINYERITL
jgi:hypothetical protein